MNAEAVDLVAEYMDVFVKGMWFCISIGVVADFGIVELRLRASSVAKTQQSGFVEVEHIERILAQLLLDF